jgi:hypothetical protein
VFVEQVELVGADVLGAELFGGAAEVAGEVGDGTDLVLCHTDDFG